LAEKGFTAAHWSTIGQPWAADTEIFDFAAANDWIVFTHDFDFGMLLAALWTSRPNVIQVRTQDVPTIRDSAGSCSRQSKPLNQTSKLALWLPWTPFVIAFACYRSEAKSRVFDVWPFCAQAVLTEAKTIDEGAPARPRAETAPPFTVDELRAYLERNAAALSACHQQIAESLRKLAAGAGQHYTNLEGLEQHLTVLEEKMIAAARAQQSEEQSLESRRELDRQLRPYRGKMTADQLSMLEKQYLERHLLERSNLPRLSLVYMR
jgi:hypothetical protein